MKEQDLILNFQRIECIYKTLIKDRLLSIFYKNWLIESGEAWKHNVAFGNVIKNQLQNQLSLDILDQFGSEQIKNIENGKIYKLYHYGLAVLILNLNSIKSNTSTKDEQRTIYKQNDIIEKLLDYHDDLIDKHLYKDNEKFRQGIQYIGSCLIQLDKLTNNTCNINVVDEINNIINDKHDDRCKYSNSDNEMKAIEMNKKGMDELEAGNNIHKARELFESALELENISNFTKCELFLNYSISLFHTTSFMIKDNKPKEYQIDDKDYEILQTSIFYINQAISLRPSYGVLYFKYGIIEARLGDYGSSIMYFKISKYLDKTLEDDVNKWIKENEDKQNIRSTSSPRNYEKESELIINKYSSLNQFNNMKLTESFILNSKTFINDALKDGDHLKLKRNLDKNSINRGINAFIDQQSKDYGGVSKQLAMEILMSNYSRFGFILSNNTNTKKFDAKLTPFEIECLIRSIGSNSDCAMPYYTLANYKMYYEKPSTPSNDKLVVSLLLKASLLPLHYKTKPFQKIQHDNFNFFVPISQCELGRIYRYGLYGEDYDLEKAQYYFEQANKNKVDIHEDVEFSSLGSFYHLGRMYYGGVNKDKVKDKELAKKLWRLGSELGDPNCTMFLKIHFSESVGDGNQRVNIDHERNISAVHNVMKIEQSLVFKTIDINSIKVISEDGKHQSNQYAKRIYLTHLKVVKFIKSFKELNLKKSTLKEKIESIKLLSLAFKDYDNYMFIRIPPTIINDIKELVDQLLISSPSNIDVKICWLGLNRFQNGYVSLSAIHPEFKIINDSFELCKNEKDYSSIKYFEVINQGYSGKTDIRFNNLIQLLDIKNDNQQQAIPSRFKITIESDKDIFIYLLLSIINNSELQSSSINNNDLINCIISNVDSYNSRSIKGNPQNAEINLNLYLLLLNSNYDNNDKNEIASKYLEIGKSEINYLIPSLKEFNVKLDKLLSLIK